MRWKGFVDASAGGAGGAGAGAVGAFAELAGDEVSEGCDIILK